jgi:hypothetical protein
MAKITLSTIGSRYGSIDALNANFDAIEEAFENTVSRDGTGPNFLQADLDANSNRIINVPAPIFAHEAVNKEYLDNVTALLQDYITEIVAVGTNIASVVAVAAISDDVVAVAADEADIGAVAANIANVNAVADNETNINAAVANETNINAVVANETNITAVADNATNINTVAAISTDVTAVATIDDDVSAVAAIGTQVSTVSNIDAEITTVAGISSNVTTVAGIAADVTLVASKGDDISYFADTYLGPKTADPTVRNDGSPLQEGDLYFNTVTDVTLVYGSSGWNAAYVSAEGFLATTGGTMTGPITLAGNPTINLHAVPKQYVDAEIATVNAAIAAIPNPVAMALIFGG